MFFTNNVGNSPVKHVNGVILDFYSDEEIVCAKELMYGELKNIFGSETPRFTMRVLESISSRDVDDIASYASKVDEAGLSSSMPIFLEADHKRVPSIKPEDLDECLILKKVGALEAAVQRHEETLQTQCRSPPDVPVHPAAQPPVQSTPAQPAIPNDAQARAAAPSSSREQADDHSWASVAGHLSHEGWSMVTNKKPRQKDGASVQRVVRGKKPVDTGSSSIKAVPRLQKLCYWPMVI